MNRLFLSVHPGDPCSSPFTFDRNGNLLRQIPGGTTAAEGETRYSYDGANRLVEVELYTGGSYTTLSTAVYNGVGERLSLTTYALGVPLTTSYTTAEGQLLVTAVGTQTTLSLYGQTQIAEYGSDWSYPLRDSTSSVRQTTNQSGEVTLARSYKPFGAILAESGPYETAFGFLGAQLDQVSGLIFMGGRYYDPTTGRFLTPDHSRTNPYAPVQGPGIWLLLPLIGIVVAWRGRKKGVGRMVVLVCVVGAGVLLVGCGEVPPAPGPDQPTPPSIPVEATPTQVPQSAEARATAAPPPPANESEVLASTIRITLTNSENDCPDDPNSPVITQISSALGTLVRHSGKYKLYTHNHYSLLNTADQVGFDNANGDLLGTITGDEFREKMNNSIPPRDAGNAIIEAPEVLWPTSLRTLGLELTPRYANFGNPEEIESGDKVSVPYQISDERIGVLEAQVLRTNELDASTGLPIFRLSTISGVPTFEGDSGGGLWFQKRIIGNTWGAVQVSTDIVNQETGEIIKEGELFYTEQFISAKLPKF